MSRRILALNAYWDSKWNLYIQPVAKDAAKMVVSLQSSSKYPTPATILYLYKTLIRPKIEQCYHIGTGVARSLLACIVKIQKCRRSLWVMNYILRYNSALDGHNYKEIYENIFYQHITRCLIISLRVKNKTVPFVISQQTFEGKKEKFKNI